MIITPSSTTIVFKSKGQIVTTISVNYTAVSSWETSAIDPHMPYMLQPEEEKRIKDKLKIVSHLKKMIIRLQIMGIRILWWKSCFHFKHHVGFIFLWWFYCFKIW